MHTHIYMFVSFCVAKNTKYLTLIFCMYMGYITVNIRFFCGIFETHKYDFQTF
jgi:hypothetical protein